MKRSIRVEQHHIDDGIPERSTDCPIALALGEVYTDNLVSVGPRDIGLGHPTADFTEMSFINSEAVTEWIKRYDKKVAVQPITITLDYQQQTADIEEVNDAAV